MKYCDVGFRALYGHFSVFPLTELLRSAAKSFPGFDQADCILSYGYIDHTAGLTLELLALGVRQETGIRFFDADAEARVMVRVGAVENEEFVLLNDDDNRLKQRYSAQLARLDVYRATDALEKSRRVPLLDPSRHPHYPDDIRLFLLKQGLEPELCWGRLLGLSENGLTAELLNEPNQNYGCHCGDRLPVFVQKREQDEEPFLCWSNAEPIR